ncbi:MAG: TIGR03663 family protein [Anaerolineales bacterium]|nr:TIGR03663 family protein [Anaerolineales bacterium]
MSELTSTPQEPQQDFLSRSLFATLNLDLEKGLYILLIILALITRFYALGDRVVSHDESLHTQFSYQFYNGDGYVHQALMHGPFLFHATAASYWLFGDNDFTSRIPVALLGVILVALPYLLRDWLGRKGALFTSFIFLISPYLLYYSRYIRHDIYVSTWALMVFIATIYYLRQTKDKYLWWFAAGNALMFATKEVSFIYVAIFGSFLVLRLLPQILVAPWLQKSREKLLIPLVVVAIGLVIAGGSFLINRSAEEAVSQATATATSEGFAVDPNVAASSEAASETSIWGWLIVLGIVVSGTGLLYTANAMRPHIDQYPEFNLIVLFTVLILPMVAPFLVSLVGCNPNEYTMSTCMLAGQETMTPLQIFFARLTQDTCRQAFFSSGLVHSGSFLIAMLAISVIVGYWWNRRRFFIAAAIFHTIFAVLYTSVFTNLGGWASGMIGSLGYWL